MPSKKKQQQQHQPSQNKADSPAPAPAAPKKAAPTESSKLTSKTNNKQQQQQQSSSSKQNQKIARSIAAASSTNVTTAVASPRVIAKWTIVWFIFAGLAASSLLAAEAFQDYRPAFPLEPVCAIAFLLHLASAVVVMRIGYLRWYPHFAIWQPFAGGLPFVASQIVGYTFWSASSLTLYLYFSVGYSSSENTTTNNNQQIITSSFSGVASAFNSLLNLVMMNQDDGGADGSLSSSSSFPMFNTSSSQFILHQRHGPLAVAGVLSACASWTLFSSLQYFGHKTTNKETKSYSLASNESRAAVVMIIVQVILTGATQWHHERHYDDAAKALGLVLLISHTITALTSHFILGHRLIPTFRWFMPFHGSIRDVLPQALSWTAFSTAIVGFRVMTISDHSSNNKLMTNINLVEQQEEGGRIGWGVFGAIGVAANIGLFLQMRIRVRIHFDEQQKLMKTKEDAQRYKKLQPLMHHPEAPPSATHFLARNTRYVLTLASVIISIYGILTSSPYIEKLLETHTGIPSNDWFLAFRILLQCQISFPLVTHVTGVVLRAYNVRNPFASSLVGSEFVALQLAGWSTFVGSIVFGLVLSPTMTPHQLIVADQWTSCLALLSQILIGSSVSLLDRKSRQQEQEKLLMRKEEVEDDANSNQEETNDKKQAYSSPTTSIPPKSTFQIAMASLPIRGMDEMFNGFFLTALVGCALSILLRLGCDLALHLSRQAQNMQQKKSSSSSLSSSPPKESDIPLPVLVTLSTLIWAASVPLLQFSIVGFNRPFQGSPLYSALQALGWATYLFVLVLLALVSVDFLASSQDLLTHNARPDPHHQEINSLQFTSQGALMCIPVFLITVSAFFSGKFDHDDIFDQFGNVDESNNSRSNNNNRNDFEEDREERDLIAGRYSGNNNNSDSNSFSNDDDDDADDQLQQQQPSYNNNTLSEKDIKELERLKQQKGTSDALRSALEQLILSTTRTSSTQRKRSRLENNNKPTTSGNNLLDQLRNPSPSRRGANKGNDLAATIVVVACLSIASLALFVAAEHLGNSGGSLLSSSDNNNNNNNSTNNIRMSLKDPRPVHVTVLGAAALLASALGCISAHALIGPALHSSDVYKSWMPFQGGAPFVSWQVTGFGSLATAFLLFCVDLVRRYQILSEIKSSSSSNSVPGIGMLFASSSIISSSFSPSASSLVPSGILSGIAPLIVLGSTFTFDKTKTALDQKGSVLYENAEASLSLVVLGGSWFLTATSELWLQSEWELATIPLFFGSIAAVVVLPIAFIAIRKSADQARFHKSDIIDADRPPDEEQDEFDEANNNNNQDGDRQEQQENDDDTPASQFPTRNDSFGRASTAAASSVNSAAKRKKKTKTEQIAMGIFSAFKTLTNAPLVLLEVVFLMLCGSLPLALIYGVYYLYNNYKGSVPDVIQGFQTTTIVAMAILVLIFLSYGLLRSFTAALGAFAIYSVPLFLLSFTSSFPLTRPYNSGAWWMLVELVLGMVPPFAIQPILTLFDAASTSLCLNHAYRLWRTGGANGSTTSTAIILTPLSLIFSGLDQATTSNYINSFLGNTTFAAFENAIYFFLLLAYKQRFLKPYETTGAKRSTAVLGVMQKYIVPGAERYFNLRIRVHGVDNKTGLRQAVRHNTTVARPNLPVESATNNNDRFYKSWAKESAQQKQPSVKKAVFGYHPHGIFAFTVPWLGISPSWLAAGGGRENDSTNICVDEVKDIEKNYEKRNKLSANTFGVLPRIVVPFAANIVFSVPTMRDCSFWLGARAATRTAIAHTLKFPKTNSKVPELPDGLSPLIVPGGQAELIESRSNTKSLTLIGYHFGFLKLAVQNRTCPAPIMGFGENDILDNVHVPKVQRFFLNRAGFPFPIFPLGVLGFTWLPKKVRLTTVVGRPVDIDAVWNEEVKPKISSKESWPAPNSEDEMTLVKAVAQYYYQELMRVFYGFREEAGYEHMDLNILMDRGKKDTSK